MRPSTQPPEPSMSHISTRPCGHDRSAEVHIGVLRPSTCQHVCEWSRFSKEVPIPRVAACRRETSPTGRSSARKHTDSHLHGHRFSWRQARPCALPSFAHVSSVQSRLRPMTSCCWLKRQQLVQVDQTSTVPGDLVSALASLQIPYAAPAVPYTAMPTLMQAHCASLISRVLDSDMAQAAGHYRSAPDDEATVVSFASITTHVTLPRCPVATH